MRQILTWMAAALILAASGGLALAQDEAEKEVTKQTTRQISSAVIGRVFTEESEATAAPFNVWSTSSYNSITVHVPGVGNVSGTTPGSVAAPPNFQVNLYEEVLGIDTRRGPFVLGASVAASYTDAGQGGFQQNFPFGSTTVGSTNLEGGSWTFSPYAAYVLNRNIFFAGVLGYTYGANWARTGSSTTNLAAFPPFVPAMTITQPGAKSSSSSNTLFTDISANGIYPVPGTALSLSGRVGTRYYYGWTSSNTGPSTGAGAIALYTAIEARYTIESLQPYARVQYEYTIPVGPGGSIKTNDVFLGAGVDYVFSKSLVAGLDFMIQQGEPAVQNWQLALNIRATF